VVSSPRASLAHRVIEASDTDLEAFLGFFTDGTVFRMANGDAVVGRGKVQAWISGYLAAVAATRHEVVETWESDGAVALRVDVTYTMRGGESFTLPAVTMMTFRAGLLAEYRIFMDPSPVVAAVERR
jgi:ketosteroid isomerase-like protein